MRCFGTVAEFNPFHNGHRALLAHARQQGATHIVAVMSGNFVQRGEGAVLDKRVRTRAALLCGADLVVELPLAYAVAPAQRFAWGGMYLLRALGCVDTLLFGSECGDVALLDRLARGVDHPLVGQRLRELLEQGITFARARQQAVEAVLGAEAAAVLSHPNNILAVEYLRQAAALDWPVKAMTLRRVGTGHDDDSPSGAYASASFLRGRSDPSQLEDYVPPEALEVIREAAEQGHFPADWGKLSTAILAKLRGMTSGDLARLPDLSEGLEDRLYRAIRSAATLGELAETLKTKRYPLARIRRLILCAFLGISREDAHTPPPYIRVLGFGPRGSALLRHAKANCPLPLHTSLARLERQNAACARFAALEAGAGDLFALSLPEPAPCGTDYTWPAVVIQE